MDFKVSPLKGVNEIEFGMNAEVVQKHMNIAPEKFRRHDEIFPSDHYVEVGAFGYYDADGNLEAMEFTNPSRVFFGEANILDLPFGQAASLLKQIDPEVVSDKDMVMSKKFSLSIWSSAGFDEENEPVEAFLVGRSGYYDFLDAPGD